MSQAAAKIRLEDLDIKPYIIAKLKMAGIQSVFDLAISIPHQLVDIDGGMLTEADEHVALELVTKAKKALVDSGLLYKDFSTAQDILDRRKNLLRCTTGSAKPILSQGRNRDPSNHRNSRGVWQRQEPDLLYFMCNGEHSIRQEGSRWQRDFYRHGEHLQVEENFSDS